MVLGIISQARIASEFAVVRFVFCSTLTLQFSMHQALKD